MSEPEIALLMSTYQRPDALAAGVAVDRVAAGRRGPDGAGRSPTTARPTRRREIVEEFARTRPVSRRLHHAPAHDVSAVALPQRRRASQPRALLAVSRRRLHFAARPRARASGTPQAGRWSWPATCCRLDQETSRRAITERRDSLGRIRPPGRPASELRRLRKRDRAVAVLSLDPPSDQAQADRQQRGHLAGRFRARQRLRRELSGLGLRRRRPAPPAAPRRRAHRVDPALDAHLSPLASDRRHRAGQLEARAPTSHYLLRKGRLTRCRNGLEKRDAATTSRFASWANRPSRADARTI